MFTHTGEQVDKTKPEKLFSAKTKVSEYLVDSIKQGKQILQNATLDHPAAFSSFIHTPTEK